MKLDLSKHVDVAINHAPAAIDMQRMNGRSSTPSSIINKESY